MLLYLVLGLALGAGSSVLPGPCGLAVMNAATRQTLARAVAIGGGAALGDAAYASLGILGIGPHLERSPLVPVVLQAVSGVVLITYGLRHLVGRASGRAGAAPRASIARARGTIAGGLLTGLVTLLSNPGALVTWVIVVGSALRHATPVQAWCAVIGIGTGSFVWFTLMAVLTRRGSATHGALVARVTAVVSSLLVAGGVLALVRAADSW